MQKLLDILRWLVLLPISFFPERWKGYRRSIVVGIVSAATTLLGIASALDVDLISNIICSVVQLWHNPGYVCNVQSILNNIIGFLVVYLPLLLEALKPESDKSIYKIPVK